MQTACLTRVSEGAAIAPGAEAHRAQIPDITWVCVDLIEKLRAEPPEVSPVSTLIMASADISSRDLHYVEGSKGFDLSSYSKVRSSIHVFFSFATHPYIRLSSSSRLHRSALVPPRYCCRRGQLRRGISSQSLGVDVNLNGLFFGIIVRSEKEQPMVIRRSDFSTSSVAAVVPRLP